VAAWSKENSGEKRDEARRQEKAENEAEAKKKIEKWRRNRHGYMEKKNSRNKEEHKRRRTDHCSDG